MKVDVLVVGGGFAGLSTALDLAERGVKDVAVIEQERKLGGHASGRNAGMIRQSVSEPGLARLAHTGRELLERFQKRSGQNIGFRKSGSLLLAKGETQSDLDRIRRTLKREGVPCRMISKKEAAKKVFFLEGGDFESALYTPSDAIVDIRALLEAF